MISRAMTRPVHSVGRSRGFPVPRLEVLQRGQRSPRVRALVKKHHWPEWCEGPDGVRRTGGLHTGPHRPPSKAPFVHSAPAHWAPSCRGDGAPLLLTPSHGFPFPAGSRNFSSKSTQPPRTQASPRSPDSPTDPEHSLGSGDKAWWPRWGVVSSLPGWGCV